jgi:NitT/TauT family transport system permease protein/taurine transport system permease protein
VSAGSALGADETELNAPGQRPGTGPDTPAKGSGAAPGRGRRGERSWRRIGVGAAGLVAALLVWEAASAVVGDKVLLPSVQLTVRQFAHYVHLPYPAQQGSTLVQDAVASTRRVLLGFLLGTAVGVGLGALMSGVRLVRDLVDPLIEVTRPLPPLAFIPLFVVWFGIGELSKVLLIALGVLPIMTIATLGALDQVPPALLNASRSLGASAGRTMLLVRLRGALPGIVTGMRLAMGGAWTSIIAAEMIAANRGIGFLILQAGNYLQTPLIFSGIVTISVLGLALDRLLRLLHRWADPSTR